MRVVPFSFGSIDINTKYNNNIYNNRNNNNNNNNRNNNNHNNNNHNNIYHQNQRNRIISLSSSSSFNPFSRQQNTKIRWFEADLESFYNFVEAQPLLTAEQELMYGKALSLGLQVDQKKITITNGKRFR